MSKPESESEDEDYEEMMMMNYFSVEPVDIDEEDKEDHTYCVKSPHATGAASSINQTPDDDSKKSPKESGPRDASSIHSREDKEEKEDKNNSQKKLLEREEGDMDSENSDEMEDEEYIGSVRSKKTSYVCFNPLNVLQQTLRQVLLLQVLQTLHI